MNLKTIIILVVLAFAVYVWRVVNAAKALQIGYGHIEGLRLNNGSVTFTCFLNVVNGDSLPVPISSVNIDNIYNGAILGKCYLRENTTIAAKSNTQVPVLVDISLFDIIAAIPTILGSIRDKVFKFALVGNIRTMGFASNVSQEYVINFNSVI